ncbi:hypothetical protein M409DRAFT_58215 [Zasmidium cellare ATCC 36951]|uniref:DJ-1/PfpI domain-containing protein n=1 Tax=Zasmidium cellare ATCC 36951 TaxID=1080233 RepID=A0A6A6C869_ZASCE|nr:uncharacterized protein M409DRAFT_58215 [Zasmidium cellare ATCC 36951]KAF2162448.1 hypothetical protein M409DRAFT_58215 [Zasmidium cellare ATCC 36951]
MASNKPFPKSFGLILFPGFEVLDVAGPIEMLNRLARREGYHDMSLSVISRTTDPVNPGPIPPYTAGKAFLGNQLYLPTHTLESAPEIDVLLVPGGFGAFDLHKTNLEDYVQFIRDRYSGNNGHQPLQYIISVCNGAGFLAKSGILDDRKATTNKDFWNEVAAYGPKTHWIAKARWVNDGNIWTTSGVSAGADGVIAWMASLIPKELVDDVVNGVEWFRAKNADNDPFAEIFGRRDIAPVAE